MFDLDLYRQRIHNVAVEKPNEQTLFDLHYGQFYHLAFENIDIQLGKSIDISRHAVVYQLLHKLRGGYCFQLNALMLMALQHIGFKVKPLLARVHLDKFPSGKTHQLTLVELNNRYWIVDVGFGAGGPRFPMPLEDGSICHHPTANFRLIKTPIWGWMLQTQLKENEAAPSWLNSYSFDLSVVTQADLAVGNHYTSTSPQVHFTQQRTVSLPTENGRVSVKNFILTRWQNGEKIQEVLPNNSQYFEILSSEFNLKITEKYSQLKPISATVEQ